MKSQSRTNSAAWALIALCGIFLLLGQINGCAERAAEEQGIERHYD